MEVRCIKVKLKENSIDQVTDWFQELNARYLEVLESMQRENIVVESAFLDRQIDGDYLIYYIKSPNIKKALETFDQSSLPIDDFYKKKWSELCGNVDVLDTLLDLDFIGKRSNRERGQT